MEKLRKESLDPDFWNDSQSASATLKKISRIEKEINLWSDLSRRHDDMEVLFEFAEAGETDIAEVHKELKTYQKIIDDVEMKLILGKPEDIQNAIVSIHPGAGGTESQDWAQMLYRMYTRWAEQEEFKVEVMDFQPGDEAGIKDVTFEIKGDYAFGMAKAEAGVHRMVRISPFDSNAKRHTSFASVFVYPAVEEDIEIDINPTDLRIDTYRASGAGGQHVNKTDSAVRITHLPTGIVAQCQNERSQRQNRDLAMSILTARLIDLETKRKEDEMAEIKGDHISAEWGNQIRSYVLHPYQMVKDHRTDLEVSNTADVLDGNIDEFITSYLTLQLNK